MDVLYAVVHREAGRLASFETAYEAGCDLVRILRDEPDWLKDLWLERVEVRVAGASGSP